jgi:hypothetical protein
MASVLAYVIDEHRDGRQMEILAGVRSSERARLVLEQGARQMQVLFKAFDDGGAGRAHRNAFLTAASFGLR